MITFPQVSPRKPCIDLSLIRATCPAILILLDLITRTILGEQYRLLCSVKFAYEIVVLRNEGKRSHSRYVGLHCGILLKTYLEIGGYEMCAGFGSRWVPITVLDLRVPRKAKNYLTFRCRNFLLNFSTPCF